MFVDVPRQHTGEKNEINYLFTTAVAMALEFFFLCGRRDSANHITTAILASLEPRDSHRVMRPSAYMVTPSSDFYRLLYSNY